MKMGLCVAVLAAFGLAGPCGSRAGAQSVEKPARAEARAASSWAGYAPGKPWKAHRPESSWRGYVPRGGWKAAPTLGPPARREGGVGRDLVTVEGPPLAGR